jgi:hypothetical protein
MTYDNNIAVRGLLQLLLADTNIRKERKDTTDGSVMAKLINHLGGMGR